MYTAVLLTALTQGLVVPAQITVGPAPARIAVWLPPGASFYVDGVRSPYTADAYTFDTPLLLPGQRYMYTVRAKLDRPGEEMSDSKQITFVAGETVTVDFRKLGRNLAAGMGSEKYIVLPTTPPPMPAIAVLDDKGRVQITYVKFKPVTEITNKKLFIDGREEELSYTTERRIPEQQTRHLALTDVEGQTADGVSVGRTDLVGRLASPTPVFITRRDQVAPFYLSSMRRDTLILTVPQELPSPSRVWQAVAPITNRQTTRSLYSPSSSLLMSGDERTLLDLINAERGKQGLGPLHANEQLFEAARVHSANMARQDKLAHVLNGRGAEDRLHKAGYTGSAWAENIAAGERTPSGAIDMWMNSEVHRGNILHPPYNQVGIGIAKNGEGVTFYTVLFGSSSAQ